MEATYPNLQTFEKKLYGYKSIEDLHYKLLNIMQLIIHNGWFYCFCNKYQGCEFDYNRVRRLCALCRMPDYLSNFEEVLDRAQFDIHALKMFGFKSFPLLLGCYVYNKRSLQAFSGHFYYSSRDCYTVEKLETSLKDQIKSNTDLKIRNGQENYFIFFY